MQRQGPFFSDINDQRVEKMQQLSTPDNSTIEVDIEKLVYGGAGLGRHRGKVVFVPFTVPGDSVEARIRRQKRNFAEAQMIRLIKPGPGRVEPRCSHFGSCGGCQWQHLQYLRQLDIKRKILEEILHHRIPQTRSLLITFKASPQDYGYRSRARLQVRRSGGKTAVGFFKYNSHGIEDVEMCPLFRPSLNRALSCVRHNRATLLQDCADTEFDLASSEEQGKWGWSTRSGMIPKAPARDVWEEPEETVLLKRFAGTVYATFPSVFFQANDFMVSELVETVMELSPILASDRVLDLFSGVGLFSLPMARRAETVVSVDNSAAACALSRRNAKSAHIRNIQTICSGVVEWMRSVEATGRPGYDLIVLNPPRAGAGPVVTRQIARFKPKSVLYISCDPFTLTRDLIPLAKAGYDIDFAQGLDLFPQTYHFETIVRLRCR